MKPSQWIQVMIMMSPLMLVGCAEVTPPVFQKIHSPPVTFLLPQRIANLAGTWEYKDAAGQGIIRLNAEGKGTYEWKNGRFETVSLQEGRWTGIWIQEENDREGGFELTFPENAASAEGEWWYTRIGKNRDPLEPGGHFTMTRPSVTPLYNKSK